MAVRVCRVRSRRRPLFSSPRACVVGWLRVGRRVGMSCGGGGGGGRPASLLSSLPSPTGRPRARLAYRESPPPSFTPRDNARRSHTVRWRSFTLNLSRSFTLFPSSYLAHIYTSFSHRRRKTVDRPTT